VSSTETKSKRRTHVSQKQVVFYSSKYAQRSEKIRQATIEKAQKIINNPNIYDKQTDKGVFSYVLNYEVDKQTGELKAKKNTKLMLDINKIEDEKRYDGYYMIVTSELDMSDRKIIDSYHGLWKIEETFKITKSDLNTRPIYLQNEERIQAHFITCYISLVILRILQLKTSNKYSCQKLINELRMIECSYIDGNYLFDYRSDLTDELEDIFSVGFGKRFMRKSDINNKYSSFR
jgi:transposase